jgi:LysR family glycine cleavage system transcriptional activator
MKWLIPRLPGFVAAHPRSRRGSWSPTVPSTSAPTASTWPSACACRTPRPRPDSDVTPFLKHSVGPVASPGLAAQAHDLEGLTSLPRLHTRTFPESWAEWEAAAGVVLPPASVNREFDHYFYMLEAAAAGLGVALSPFAFVENDLATGRLVAPLGLVPGQALVCALTPRGRATRAARRFRDWLVAEGATTPPPPGFAAGSQQLVEPASAKPLTLSRPAL